MTSPESSDPGCWPDDQDYLDGRVLVSSSAPGEEEVSCYFDTTLLDAAGSALRVRIDVGEPFRIRYRVETQPRGRWADASGTWSFDLVFAPIGGGSGFNLSDHVPPGVMQLEGWRGAQTPCIEVLTTVLPNSLPGTGWYEAAATGAFQPTGGSIAAISSIEALEEYSLLAGSRGLEPQAQGRAIFISYSHHDRKLVDRLLIHLKPLRRENLLDVWDDSRIKPGAKWREEIERALNKAGAAILMISPDFLASDFVMNDEVPALLQQAERRGTVIIPLIVAPSLFSQSILSRFQAINTPETPLSKLNSFKRDEVLVKVATSISALLS